MENSPEKTVAIIPARGGSKGVPGKNVRELFGKPMICWTIDAALNSGRIDLVVVSTEDQEIASIAEDHFKSNPKRHVKWMVYPRDRKLAQDHVQTDEVYLDVVRYLEVINKEMETLVFLQPDSPFRTAVHVRDALKYFHPEHCGTLIPVTKAKGFYYRKDNIPNFAKEKFVELDPIGHDPRFRAGRQHAWQSVYKESGCMYITSYKNFIANRAIRVPPYCALLMEEIPALEIDTPEDWDRAVKIAEGGYFKHV